MDIAIIEDSGQELSLLERYLQTYLSKRQVYRTIDTYTSGNEFLENWPSKSYDLIFLDILMDGISGIEVARKIRETDSECLLIFISSSKEYALQGFEVRAFDYLLKPLSEERFQRTMELCHNELVKHIRYIEVKESRTLVKIPLGEIIYTDYYNHYIQIHTSVRLIRSYQQFDVFSPLLLCYPQFLCCYRNCIVNMDHVASVDKHDFIMENGERVPITRGSRNAIYQKYADYQFLKINGGI
ncbi:LytR/AlgR family response regulator transcription factor [Clostridium transplantifaecale]|uniref:LytR/AlgR family response regulator transcription factor n=1 Tax=Clostridium transplantifaecale TaxID=2479838 RepID=UPI000F632D0C|nr:LytTR family DNA-binding domain-containing protein [Clostridium transplantifaecale]